MRFSLGLLSSTGTLREDEMTVATNIKSKLSPRDAVQFDKLHNDLKDGVIKILQFIYLSLSLNLLFYIHLN